MASPNLALTIPAATATFLGRVGSGGTIYVQNSGGTNPVTIAPSSGVTATNGIVVAIGTSFQYTYGPNSTADTWYAFSTSGTTVNCMCP